MSIAISPVQESKALHEEAISASPCKANQDQHQTVAIQKMNWRQSVWKPCRREDLSFKHRNLRVDQAVEVQFAATGERQVFG